MASAPAPHPIGLPSRDRVELIPRLRDQGYTTELIGERRRWVERKADCELSLVGSFGIPGEEMRGNVENPIGAAQMPLGVIGPLRVRGESEDNVLFVPLATTEGALVRSYERGAVALTRAGGATARVHLDENRVTPLFWLPSVEAAYEFAAALDRHLPNLRQKAEATTRHGKLLRVEPHPVGREVLVSFAYYTADAQGMNMIVKATDNACRWLVANTAALGFQVFSGYNSEKRASGVLLAGGKGKRVTAGAKVPARVVSAYLHTTPEQMVTMWHRTVVGHLQAGSIGYNGHYANGLAALFIACGQDVANVANSAVGITNFEVTTDGDLYASVTLHSLSVATVGGGTHLGTSRECLQLLGCLGNGGARRLAEIVAATLLGGELSMGAAIASGEFVKAHETYGRNRPESSA